MAPLLTAFLALAAAWAPAPAPEAECTCAAARIHNAWCDACAVGYVAAVPVRSAILFEALDAHGHEIDAASIQCASCRSALRTDGYCAECRRGFVEGDLYFSKLTWSVARGETVEAAELECAVCRAAAGPHPRPAPPHWCDGCGAGIVGNVRYTDRSLFDQAAAEYHRLLKAVKRSQRCEYCGVALFMDARCPRCRILYRDGEAVEPASGEDGHVGHERREGRDVDRPGGHR